MTGAESGNVSIDGKTARRIAQFRFSVDLFERNHTELVVFLDYLCSPRVAFSFSWTDERWLLHEAMKEVGFLLHNFVAAAKSLIDHTRVLHRQLYEEDDAIPDYQQQIEERFAEDPLTQFMIKLREFVQHYQLPMVGLSVESGEIQDGVSKNMKIWTRLDVDDLYRFDGWNRPAKKYLEEAGDTLDLRVIVGEYFNHVVAFYEWFEMAQRQIHGRLPDLYERILLHGTEPGNRPEVKALEEGVRELEGMNREEITFEDLETAFRPVLSVLDEQRLMLCRHDVSVWQQHAMRAVKSRFNLSGTMEERIVTLLEGLARAPTSGSEGTDS